LQRVERVALPLGDWLLSAPILPPPGHATSADDLGL
jgi:hypothetical protein